MSAPLLVILGPTASGKTKLAAQLAARLNGEIISADSRQVYRELNIGTGKDYADYMVNGRLIPYHLIDIVNPGERFTVSDYLKDFDAAKADIENRNRQAILCGGTGNYIEAALKGLTYDGIPTNEILRAELLNKSKEELKQYFVSLPTTSVHHTADTSTQKRLIRAIEIAHYLNEHPEHQMREKRNTEAVIIGLKLDKKFRDEKIKNRLQLRMQQGLIEEGQRIYERYGPQVMHRLGLEYKFLALYLSGELSLSDFIQQLEIAIRQFAKRQMTYFRKMEKEGLVIRWLNAEQDLGDLIEQSLQYV